MDLFVLLDPHFKMLGIGTLQELGHISGEIGIWLPDSPRFLGENDLAFVRLADDELHGWPIGFRLHERIDAKNIDTRN